LAKAKELGDKYKHRFKDQNTKAQEHAVANVARLFLISLLKANQSKTNLKWYTVDKIEYPIAEAIEYYSGTKFYLKMNLMSLFTTGTLKQWRKNIYIEIRTLLQRLEMFKIKSFDLIQENNITTESVAENLNDVNQMIKDDY
jgi:hypothetical protein